MPEVKEERTGWRDEALSRRHRMWGWDCPAIDIDFLVVEYDNGKPKAIVEYKHECADTQHSSHPSYRAITDLADASEIPFFACRYAEDFSWWRVAPLNGYAKDYLPETSQMQERDWVSILYKVRGRKLPPESWLYTDIEI